jgi:hypothetical protein
MTTTVCTRANAIGTSSTVMPRPPGALLPTPSVATQTPAAAPSSRAATEVARACRRAAATDVSRLGAERRASDVPIATAAATTSTGRNTRGRLTASSRHWSIDSRD